MGGGWPRETVLPHSGKPTPPRFARLPLPEEGSRMIFKETLIQSLSFAVRDSRSPPHVPRASPLSSGKEMVGAGSGVADIAEKAPTSPQIDL